MPIIRTEDDAKSIRQDIRVDLIRAGIPRYTANALAKKYVLVGEQEADAKAGILAELTAGYALKETVTSEEYLTHARVVHLLSR